MFSNTIKYSIKALTFLADCARDEKKCRIKEIAKETSIPEAYLAKILHRLAQEGIISSSKGPGGGFFLTTENREISVFQVLTVLDPDYNNGNCMMGFEACNIKNPCALHDVYTIMKVNFLDKVKRMKIGDLSYKRIEQHNRMLI